MVEPAALMLQCQQCRCRLALQAGDGGGGPALDESYMLLEGEGGGASSGGRSLQQQGGSGSGDGGGSAGAGGLQCCVLPLRRWLGTGSSPERLAPTRARLRPHPTRHPAAPGARRLDESFVVLAGSRPGAASAAAAQSVLLDGGGGGVQRIPFDARLRALARVYEAASGEGRVDHPLCAECAGEVHRELEAQLAELQQVSTALGGRGVACGTAWGAMSHGQRWQRVLVPGSVPNPVNQPALPAPTGGGRIRGGASAAGGRGGCTIG